MGAFDVLFDTVRRTRRLLGQHAGVAAIDQMDAAVRDLLDDCGFALNDDTVRAATFGMFLVLRDIEDARATAVINEDQYDYVFGRVVKLATSFAVEADR